MKITKYLDFGIDIKNTAGVTPYPNPGMAASVKELLARVNPLVSKETFDEFQALLGEFLESEDAAFAAEEIERLSQNPDSSFLYDYWIRRWAKERGPQHPHANVPVIYDHPQLTDHSTPFKAATIIKALTDVYLEFRARGNSSYSVGRRVYSNDQMYGLLGSLQDLHEGYDTLYINDEVSTNFLILHKNRVYSLEVVTEDSHSVSLANLLATTEDIYQDQAEPLAVNVNLATAAVSRDRGAKVLHSILDTPVNQVLYAKVKNAIGLVNLDRTCPESLIDELKATTHDSQCFNRWAGKGIQFTINGNGTMSFISNHTMADGGTYAHLAHLMSEKIEGLEIEATGSSLSYEPLEFLLSDQEEQELVAIFQEYQDEMRSLSLIYRALPQLTRESLRALGVLSGDGFLHLALQVAQARVFQKVRNTYAPIDARHFFKGRTKANRPVNNATLGFVEAFEEGRASKEDLLEVLDLHFRNTRLAQSGGGAERYITIMGEILKDHGRSVPAFMEHKGYQTLNQDFITTTSFGTPEMIMSFFPPSTPQGLAVFYKVMDDTDEPSINTSSQVVVTVYEDQEAHLETFATAIESSISDLLSLLEE